MVSDARAVVKIRHPFGLNPCSNGIWSLTKQSGTDRDEAVRLNPCSNGIWSLTDNYHGLRRDPFLS